LKFTDRLAEIFDRQAPRYLTHFIDVSKVAPTYDNSPIAAGSAYIRIWLAEMRLSKDVSALASRYPVVHSSVRFVYSGEAREELYVAKQELLEQLKASNLNQTVLRNIQLTPLFPFNGGIVEIQAGLFSMKDEDRIRIGMGILSDFADILPVPGLKLAGRIYEGLGKLFGQGDGQLELGYRESFVGYEQGQVGANFLRPGYIVAMLASAERDKIDPRALSVANDTLSTGSPSDAKMPAVQPDSLNGKSYLLFKIERRASPDYEMLSEINDLFAEARDALIRGQTTVVDQFLLPRLLSAILRSPDLIARDREAVARQIYNQLKQFRRQGAHKERGLSLTDIMMQPAPASDPALDRQIAMFAELDKVVH